jgi:antimicrobial peptide system SdpA family protein
MHGNELALRRLGVTVLVLATGWFLAALYALHAALPSNVIRLPLEDSLKIGGLAPQGWAFFTRDPRERDMLMFVKTDAGWLDASLGPNASLQNLGGISRNARGQGIEVGMLVTRLPPEAWTRCRARHVKACLDEARGHLTLPNLYPRPTLCADEVALVLVSPTPWAWSGHSRTTLQAKVARFSTLC